MLNFDGLKEFFLRKIIKKKITGADPGFLERGFIFIKRWFVLLILSHFSSISYENEII